MPTRAGCANAAGAFLFAFPHSASSPCIAVQRTASLSLAYDPAIHEAALQAEPYGLGCCRSSWIAGSSPAMTDEEPKTGLSVVNGNMALRILTQRA
jgi:hypothetical protein